MHRRHPGHCQCALRAEQRRRRIVEHDARGFLMIFILRQGQDRKNRGLPHHGDTPQSRHVTWEPGGRQARTGFDAAYNNDAAADSGSVSYAAPVLTWTGDLTPGGSAVITYTVTVNDPDTGDKILTSTAVSDAAGSNCPSGGTDTRCTATVTDLIPALTISKTAPVSTTTPGSTVTYTITVADTGQTPYTPATVTDSLAGVLGDAGYDTTATTASSGSVSYAAPVLTWTGDLTPGAAATITYSATIDNPDTGGRVLTNAAVSADPGSNCPAGSTDPRCAVSVGVIAGALSINTPISSDLGSAVVGGTVQADLGNVQVTDNRGFGVGWTATVSSTGFSTGGGTPGGDHPGRRRLLRRQRVRRHQRRGHLHHGARHDPRRHATAGRERHQRERRQLRHLESADRRERAGQRGQRPVHRDHHPLGVVAKGE